MPYVSVVIPAYNAADFIIDAYRSIVDQTIDDWEIIFVNDGSQDNTLSILRSIAAADKRVNIVDLASNSGPACARNAALTIAEGDWIAMLDADDRYSRDRLEVLTSAGERSRADIVLDNQFVIDPVSRGAAFLAFEPKKDDITTLDFTEFLRNNQSNTFFDFGYLQPIIRRRWLTVNNIKYSEKLRLGEDLMLLFECYARRASVILLSKPYYHYYFQYSQSGTKSPTTRTEMGSEPLLAEIEQFLKRYHSELSPLERGLVASGCEATREAMMVAALRADMKNFGISGLICSLWHPVRLFRGIYFAKKRRFLQRRRLRTFPRNEGHLVAGPSR
jgi:succinoglycan biosynthesis protein ExoO